MSTDHPPKPTPKARANDVQEELKHVREQIEKHQHAQEKTRQAIIHIEVYIFIQYPL